MTLIPRWGAAWGRSLVVECVTDRMPASVERRQTDSRLLQFTCRMGTSGVRALPIVMLLLLTSCSLPATTSPSSSPTSSSVPAAGEETHAAIDSGRILFGVEGRTGSGGTELRVLHGSELEQVETGDPTLAHVAWAGGDAIVYDSEPTPGRQVYRRADFHDAAAELLAPNAIAGSADAAVSADGKLAAFAASMPFEGQAVGLAVVPVNGGEVVEITLRSPIQDPVQFDDYPSFSPDGRQIVYLHVSAASEEGEALTGGMFIVGVGGGISRRVSPDVQFPGPPRFSPDGTQILFSAANSTASDTSLWVVPVGGGDPTELFAVPPNASAANADWSPDGTELVFQWYEKGWDHNELRVSNLDGSDMQTIWMGTSRTSAETPDWAD